MTRIHAYRHHGFRLPAVVLLAGCLVACGATETTGVEKAGGSRAAPVGQTEAEPYRQGRRSPDGIGKFYFDREISQVMGHLGAGWLERPEREREERTDLLIGALPLEPDDVVADIGAGTGYFSFRMAARVPEGRVFAVDIQPEMLAIIQARVERGDGENVIPVRGTVVDPGLPENEVDLMLLVDAYHEFSHPAEMGAAMARSLVPGGRLVLIEYRAEDPTVPIKPLHKMSEAQARREMQAVGLEWVRTENFLPQQHFMVFQRPRETEAP
jgi:FkbM family methyltransferase